MSILQIAQIIISIVFIVLVLIQQRGTALGSAFGGGGDSFHNERRGVEKNIFWTSVVFGVLFFVFSLLNIVL